MKKDEKDKFIGLIITIVVLALFLTMTSIDANRTWKEKGMLGQALCSEEYDADFVSFFNGVLTCKPRIEDRSYGDIKVKMDEYGGLCAY